MVRTLSARQALIVVALVAASIYTYRSALSIYWQQLSFTSASGTIHPNIAPRQYENIFAFGDSLSETLFNPDFDMPTAENPFGNVWPGVTSSGGPNWLGVLIHDHLKTTWLYNLAMGGAQVSSADFDDEEEGHRDLIFQVDTFLKKTAEGKTPSWKPEHTLFSAWFGANDVHGGFFRMKKHDLHDRVLSIFFKQLDRLVDLGAQTFLIMTPEPIHLTHYHKFGKGDANKELREALYDWNFKLKTYTKQWQAKRGTYVYFVDVTTLIEKALDDKVAQPCTVDEDGGDKEVCMWQDQFHLGVIPHRMIAEQVVKTIST